MTKNPDQRVICLSGGNIHDRNALAIQLHQHLGEDKSVIVRSVNERLDQHHIGRSSGGSPTHSDILQMSLEARDALDKDLTVITVSEMFNRSTAKDDFCHLAAKKNIPLSGIILDFPGVTTLAAPGHWRSFPAGTELPQLLEYIAAAQIPKSDRKQGFAVAQSRPWMSDYSKPVPTFLTGPKVLS